MKTLNADLLVLGLCLVLRTRCSAAAAKTEYNIQHGQCSYTFLLPEPENCQSQSDNYPVQKDGPMDQDESAQRLEQLEMTMENNTQWLLKVTLHPITWLSHHRAAAILQHSLFLQNGQRSSRGYEVSFIWGLGLLYYFYQHQLYKKKKDPAAKSCQHVSDSNTTSTKIVISPSMP